MHRGRRRMHSAICYISNFEWPCSYVNRNAAYQHRPETKINVSPAVTNTLRHRRLMSGEASDEWQHRQAMAEDGGITPSASQSRDLNNRA